MNKCPHCKNGDIHVHPGGRMCGCDNCHSIFRYPSMIPYPTSYEGQANGKSLWALAEFLSEEAETPEVPNIQVSEYAGKRIATWSD